jgi:hypothetical protein
MKIKVLKNIVRNNWRLIVSFMLFIAMFSFPMWLFGAIEIGLVSGFFSTRLSFFIMWLFFPIAGLSCCYDIAKCRGLKWYLLLLMIVIHVGSIIFMVYFIYGDDIVNVIKT